jgi:hypothetical protein
MTDICVGDTVYDPESELILIGHVVGDYKYYGWYTINWNDGSITHMNGDAVRRFKREWKELKKSLDGATKKE